MNATDSQAPAPAENNPTKPAGSRRRVIGIAAGLALTLAVASVTWWGIARNDAHAQATDLVERVTSAQSAARTAADTAASAEAERAAIDVSIVTRVLDLAAASPGALSPEIVETLVQLHAAASPTADDVSVATSFASEAGELTDAMLWGGGDDIRRSAEAEIDRLQDAEQQASARADASAEVVDQTRAALAALVADTAARAADAQARLEHAGELRETLAAQAAALGEFTEGASADDWLPAISTIEEYAATASAAQAQHDARVAEIEAERIAAEERAAAEQAPPSGGGGGGGGGTNWCPEVNWTGYIILVPC